MCGLGLAGTDDLSAGEFTFFRAKIFFDHDGIARMSHEGIEYQYLLH
jgi:hypothetical protein